MDVRSDAEGNADQQFYAAWDTALYEASAQANINNDLLSAWAEADIWNELEEDKLNRGAVASQRKSNVSHPRTTASPTKHTSRAVDDESDPEYAILVAPAEAPRSKVASQRKSNLSNPRTTSSSTKRASKAVDDESDQDYAILVAPAEAPCSKRRRVDSRPSSTALVTDQRQQRDAPARRSVFHRMHYQPPRPQRNGPGSRNNAQSVAPSGEVGWGHQSAVAQQQTITQLETLQQIQAISEHSKQAQQAMAPSTDAGRRRRPRPGAQPSALAQPKSVMQRVMQRDILKQIRALNEQRRQNEDAATQLHFRLQAHNASMQRQQRENEETTRELVEALQSERQGAPVAAPTGSRGPTSRSIATPEALQGMRTRMLERIAAATRIDQQNAALRAINDAAATTDAALLNDDNPLYCVVCMELMAEEALMKGWTCHIRRHFVCQHCWLRIDFCPTCGKTAQRFLPQEPQ